MVAATDRALRRDDRLRADRGLPAALGRPGQLEPGTNPLPVAAAELPGRDLQGRQHLLQRQPVPRLQGHAAGRAPSSQNVCGEWYFPWHSHALNEFTNFDEGFGGMGTLLRVDPPGGCFGLPPRRRRSSAARSRAAASPRWPSTTRTYYQVNPKTTTRPTATTAGQTRSRSPPRPASRPAGNYYVRIDNEVLQVTGGQGTTTWTVSRGQLGTAAASHPAARWSRRWRTTGTPASPGVPAGSQNLKVTYKGKNCGSTTGTTCAALTTNMPQQTVKICNWTVAGAAGCATATSAGWVTLPAPPAQPQSVGLDRGQLDLDAARPGGELRRHRDVQAGQVRVLVHTQRWTAPSPTPSRPGATS